MGETHPSERIVVDAEVVERYVREAKATVASAAAYVVVLGLFVVLRIFLDVPYLRAALGLYAAASAVLIVAKHRLHRLGLLWLVGSAALGLAVNAGVLMLLVERGRGTLFAESTALLMAVAVTHVLDRVAARRG